MIAKTWKLNKQRVYKAVTMASALALAGNAMAVEPGLPDTYPLGNESYMTGALPPPGTYGMVFFRSNHFDALKDNNGNNLPVDFKLTANVVAPRFVWVPSVKALGGDMVLHAIAPLVDLNVKLNGATQSKRGLGDMVVGIGTGYHLSPNLHVIPAIDVIAPTGDYKAGDLANLGNNHWGIQPMVNVTYVNGTGFNGDIKAMYTFNSTNRATDYRNGQELVIDYDAGVGLGNGWGVGVGGYYYRQMTNDQLAGQDVLNNKARGVGFGPAIKYDSGKGWFVTGKWQADSGVRNHAAGNSLVIKAVFPLY